MNSSEQNTERYLNDFHWKRSEAAQKGVEDCKKRQYSLKEMLRMSRSIHPHLKHLDDK